MERTRSNSRSNRMRLTLALEQQRASAFDSVRAMY